MIFGDHNAFAGDWAYTHTHEYGCPQHALYYGGFNTVLPDGEMLGQAALKATFEADIESYRNSFDFETNTFNQAQATQALVSIFNKMDPTLFMESLDSDQSEFRVSANRFGGSMQTDLIGHSSYYSTQKDMIDWSSFQEQSALQGFEDVETLLDIDLGTTPSTRTWWVAGLTESSPPSISGKLVSWSLLMDTDAGVYESDEYYSPFFVFWNGTAWQPSLYQPQFFDECDAYSGSLLKRRRHGYIGGAKTDSFSCVSAVSALRIAPSGTNGVIETHLAGISSGLQGSFGVLGSNRPAHDLLISVPNFDPASAARAASKKDGNMSVSMFSNGCMYNAANQPIDGADWWATSLHCNEAVKQYYMQSFSLQAMTGASNTMRMNLFHVPMMNLTYTDTGGKGWDPDHNPGSLTAYQFTREPSPRSSWHLPVPSGLGGETVVAVLSIPAYTPSFKMWSYTCTDNGVAIAAGRYTALDSNDSGVEGSVPGPLWTSRPTVWANLMFVTSGQPNHLIPRYTYRIAKV